MVYKKSFETKGLSSLELDLKNIPLQISPSLDDKIYVNFFMEFENYSEDEMNTEIRKLKVNFNKEAKKITVEVKSKTIISKDQYFYNTDSGFVIKNGFSGKDPELKSKKRKSKKEILNQIKRAQLVEEVSVMSEIIKQVKKDKNSQRRKSSFSIMVPEHLILKVVAEESRIILEHEETTNLLLKMSGGSFQGRKIINSKIDVNEGTLKIEELDGGKMNLKDTSKSLIGKMNETSIEMETSKIEIGEIDRNVKIKDFNSELFLYNFSSEFKTFNFTGEYSKIYFYEPVNDYGMTAFGHNTTFHFDKNTIISKPSKKNKKSKMMDRKPKNKNPSGTINLDIIHSIFYYPTSIIINKQIP
jgi:hypothetical protein